MPSSPETRRRMRSVLRRIRDNDTAWQSIAPSALTPPTIAAGPPTTLRPQAVPGNRFRRLRQERSDRASLLGRDMTSADDSIAGLHAAGERLAQVNEDLRNLLARPIASTRVLATLQSGMGNESVGDDAVNRRPKRRRVGNSPDETEYPSIEYGYHGQIVPGRLTLQLVSSDGGIVDTPLRGFDEFSEDYSADNILRDDFSVYCTKSARCNMVLRHQGGTTFCLDKLVIKAPKHGFSDPVQEGLVFVSMRMDEVFDRTAQYQIYYFPTSRFASDTTAETARRRRRADGQAALDDYTALRPHRVDVDTSAPRSRRSSQLVDDTITPFDCGPLSDEDSEQTQLPQHSARDSESGSSSSDSEDGIVRGVPTAPSQDPRPTLPSSAALSERARLLTSMRAMRERDADGGNAEAIRRIGRGIEHLRSQRETLNLELAQSDFDEVLRHGEATTADRRSRRALLRSRIDQHSQTLPEAAVAVQAGNTNHEMHHAPAASRISSPMDSSESARSTNNLFDLLDPVARFSMRAAVEELEESEQEPHEIEEPYHTGSGGRAGPEIRAVNRYKMTIKFDPPISGKFILLKMWSPRHGGNIDIQNISAWGYAGPRGFPKMELR